MTLFNKDLQKRVEILNRFINTSLEPFYHEYKDHFEALAEIAKLSGDEGEGSTFYRSGTKNELEKKTFVDEFRNKRQGLALFAMSHCRVLEIGFNSGFSSLLMLVSNPELKVVSVDIGHHSYVKPCGEYLKKHFADRFELIIGDSREALPVLFHDDKSFDGYHIDGGHDTNVAETDLCNIINNADNGSVICFDDADFAPLRSMLTLYLLKGSVTRIFDHQNFYLSALNQVFLRVNK